jgi:hypothetical protein
MNCFYHPEETAVASCVDCGRGLCKTCASQYTIAICSDCNLKRNTNEKNLALKKYIPSLILFAAGFIFGFKFLPTNTNTFSAKIATGFVSGWFLGGTIWGWFITRKWFRREVYATGFIKAARDTFRVGATIFVGFVAMPVGIVRLIIGLVKAQKTSQTINANRTDK